MGGGDAGDGAMSGFPPWKGRVSGEKETNQKERDGSAKEQLGAP